MATMKIDLSDIYKDYIACLNEQGWSRLRQFIGDEVIYNGQSIGISGHRAMLERDFQEIPDLYFDIELLISESPYVACRLRFDCTPKREFLGLQVNGKKVYCRGMVRVRQSSNRDQSFRRRRPAYRPSPRTRGCRRLGSVAVAVGNDFQDSSNRISSADTRPFWRLPARIRNPI